MTLSRPTTQIKIHAHTRENYDPTRTTTLRNTFARQMKKRFRALRGIIRKAIVDNDVFGLKQPTVMQDMNLPPNRAFAFTRTADKVQGFMDWLNEQVDRGILETFQHPQLGRGIEEAWTNVYIKSAYQQGVLRSRQEMINAGYDVSPIEEGVSFTALLNQEMHADRLGVLYTRAFEELKGISSQMSTQISRVLTQGLAEGRNPREIANILTKTISGPVGDLGITDTLGRFIPAERRAVILARTEIIRAHHLGNITEMKNWQVVGVKVKAEWQTAGDSRVCSDCASLQGSVYTLDEIENKIPLHPQCRCVALPLDITDEKTEEETEQVREVTEPAEKKEAYEWEKVKTKEAAIAEMDKFGFSSVRIKGKQDAVRVAMTRINAIGEDLTRVFNERPGIAKFIEDMKKQGKLELRLIFENNKYVTTASGNTVAGLYNPKTSSLFLPSRGSISETLKLGSRTQVVGDGLLSTARHEYAHAIFDVLDGQNKGRWNMLVRENGGATFLKENISRYAATDIEEAFAEAFSAWTSKQYGQKGLRLPDVIEKYFEEVFK